MALTSNIKTHQVMLHNNSTNKQRKKPQSNVTQQQQEPETLNTMR